MNYKPIDGWTGDIMPFFWNGRFHLFYLKDFRDIEGHGEGTPWFHLSTTDFVTFVEHGESLARGSAESQDLYVFTGSVLRAQEKFHIFYCGHNPHFSALGRPQQGVMHAVSDDLISWTKVTRDPLFAPPERYEVDDWRDPFVFWNDEAKQYWMLLAGRLRSALRRRNGCTALCVSDDLENWRVEEPLYAPGLFLTHECPDLFRIGDWWYLLFSEYSEAWVTRYRMARTLDGPWLTPAVDTFDNRAFYAAKTASDGTDRFLFGWNPTREHSKDDQPWQWAGNLVVHQLRQETDGALAVTIPQTIRDRFAAETKLTFVRAQGDFALEGGWPSLRSQGTFTCVSGGALPKTCKIEADVDYAEGTRAFGVMLRTSADFENGYYIRFEPTRSRLVFDRWPRPGDVPHMAELERPVTIEAGRRLSLVIIVNESICEVYVDDRVAMSARMYEHAEGDWGVFVTDGEAQFSNIRLATL